MIDLTITGKERWRNNNLPDDNLGLIYMNARFYLPGTGRFASADTIVPDPADPQSFNRYSYVRNNPLGLTDPSGYCESHPTFDSFDQGCWEAYDELSEFMANNGDFARAVGWDGEEAKKWNIEKLRSLLGVYSEHRIQLPRACWSNPSSGRCNRAKWSQMQDDFVDEILPDAFIAGVSGDIGGGIPGKYTAGAEGLLVLENLETEVFAYYGRGTAGAGASADISGYFGGVWNLDNVEDYSGEFWVFVVDLSAIAGYELTFFGEPGALPFSGDTWGVSGSSATGISSSATLYSVEYVTLDTFLRYVR